MDTARRHDVSCAFMRLLSASLSLLLILFLAPPAQANREMDMVHALTQAHTRAELDVAIDAAKSAQMRKQIIVEARLLFGFRSQDTDFLVSLIPDLESTALEFAPQYSIAGLGTVEQLRGLIAYVRALAAMEHKDADSFREQINEAFWNCPQQAGLFGQAVEQFQLRDKMSRWTVDFATPLLASGDKETTLAKVIAQRKAVLLVFWADSAPASVNAMPAVQQFADYLATQNIAVAGLNVDRAEAEPKAERVRAEKKLKMPWLIELEDRALSSQLEISDLPRAVLITQQGRVVFHGHPLEPSLWRALKRISPTLTPPEG